MSDRPIKVLIAKHGLDGHDRGAKVLARGLRLEFAGDAEPQDLCQIVIEPSRLAQGVGLGMSQHLKPLGIVEHL